MILLREIVFHLFQICHLRRRVCAHTTDSPSRRRQLHALPHKSTASAGAAATASAKSCPSATRQASVGGKSNRSTLGGPAAGTCIFLGAHVHRCNHRKCSFACQAAACYPTGSHRTRARTSWDLLSDCVAFVQRLRQADEGLHYQISEP
jgi:hypothetical protein